MTVWNPCDIINVENKPRNSPSTDPCRTPEVTGNTPEDELLHTRIQASLML